MEVLAETTTRPCPAATMATSSAAGCRRTRRMGPCEPSMTRLLSRNASAASRNQPSTRRSQGLGASGPETSSCPYQPASNNFTPITTSPLRPRGVLPPHNGLTARIMSRHGGCFRPSRPAHVVVDGERGAPVPLDANLTGGGLLQRGGEQPLVVRQGQEVPARHQSRVPLAQPLHRALTVAQRGTATTRHRGA